MIDLLYNDQGWDAFGSPVTASSASTTSPAEVDGLTKGQVDALFQEADGNHDGRYASCHVCKALKSCVVARARLQGDCLARAASSDLHVKCHKS